MGFLSSILPSLLEVGGEAFGAPPGVGSAIGHLFGGGGSSAGGAGGPGAAAADPFASQRPQYQQQLQQLMTGQFSPSDPSYQWRFNQGLEGVNRGAAGSGMLRSGNRLAALQDYGQGQASTEYQAQFGRLSQLAGANIGSPSVAGQMIQQGEAGASATGQQLGSKLGSSFSSWWKGINSGGGGDSSGAVGPASGAIDNTLF